MVSLFINYFLAGIITIGLVAAIYYTLKRGTLTLRQLGFAGLAALGWGIGWYLGYLPVAEKWNIIHNYLLYGYPTADMIGELHLSGYYALGLGGISASLLGSGVLYFLIRFVPTK